MVSCVVLCFVFSEVPGVLSSLVAGVVPGKGGLKDECEGVAVYWDASEVG